MPQHLKIEVEVRLVGWLRTRSKGGTIYDVSLCVPELGRLRQACPPRREPLRLSGERQGASTDLLSGQSLFDHPAILPNDQRGVGLNRDFPGLSCGPA